MKNKKFFLAASLVLGISAAVMLSFTGCAVRAEAQQPVQNPAAGLEGPVEPGQTSRPRVYFTSDISPAGLMAVYNALGQRPGGRVAVKISTGESPNSNHLRPDLIKALVQSVNGTLVESNTAYGGRRASTALPTTSA